MNLGDREARLDRLAESDRVGQEHAAGAVQIASAGSS